MLQEQLEIQGSNFIMVFRSLLKDHIQLSVQLTQGAYNKALISDGSKYCVHNAISMNVS